jgi:predicted nucleotidyltransferase
MINTKADIIELITSASREIANRLGENLLSVYLFGSRIRGDHTEDSDLDVLVIVKTKDIETANAIIEVMSEIDREVDYLFVTGVLIKEERHILQEKALNTGFYRNVSEEGVCVYGTPLT